jgi:8-oxo-dGTP diphosphatase
MAIRNAANAIIIRDGKILLIKYVSQCDEIYYQLPGGGQLQYETMEEAAVRECREETGYRVKVIRPAAIAEEIFDAPELRNKYPDYAHRIHHIFIAEITGGKEEEATETDIHQAGCVWVDIKEVQTLTLLPGNLGDNLQAVINSGTLLYLGTIHENRLKID